MSSITIRDLDPAIKERLRVRTAEHGHSYQVIDGTRGDEGNDGWLQAECRIYAIYCPFKPERRTDADYRDKVYSDLKKAALLRDNERYPVERWTFVTPRKLPNDVIVAMRKRGEELGLEANHVEATALMVATARDRRVVGVRARDHQSGREIARGLAAYGAGDAERIAGKRSLEIEAILGYRGRDEMIHRDDLALTGLVS